METNRIIHGDALEEMYKFEVESIDLVVTDPPYGYSFMGKDWDKAVPSVDIWKQCLRVLKSGAFAFVMSSPRADVLAHMIVNLSDAGFRTDFTPIYWAYASGFPKAMNISKAVDKRLGLHREKIPNPLAKKQTGQEAEKGLVGAKSANDFLEPNPISDEAKLLDGSYGGFQPKPAVEVIIVAMKPLSEKTFIDQALKNQKGTTWLDNCRIPTNPNIDDMLRKTDRQARETETWENGSGFKNQNNSLTGVREDGRFPANLLVSDDCVDTGKVSESRGHFSYAWNKNPYEGGWKAKPQEGFYSSDIGDFSRYFSLDAWFEKQFKKLPLEVQRTFPFLIEPKASKSERDKNLESTPEKAWVQWQTSNGTSGKPSSMSEGRNTKRRNIHPTVKPLQLMSYLITLGSRPNDLVLDPFVGSGTTCLAAKMLGRYYIGIEKEAEYVKIAEARVNSFQTLDNYSVNTL